MAYVLRFKSKQRGHLSIKELNQALLVILKLVQRANFQEEFKQLSQNKTIRVNSNLRALNPFLDADGLIRVGGRLKNSLLPYNEKHQIVLPKNNHITNLIIRKQHMLNLHGREQTTLNAVRLKYWPVNGRSIVKSIINKCVTCFRAKPKISSYIMGDLPENRVIQTRPFLNTGLDYCGPFYIKEKKYRNRGKIKVYACIFVCFATKAIHIEMINDLTTDAFLSGLRRFFARRGISLNLYSDNATNFVGANNELKRVIQLLKSQEHNNAVTQFLNTRGTQWHFSPPNSPHFGGLWEAGVKSFKGHFYKTVDDKLFTYEELITYSSEIEAVLNSRPITPLSEDPNDLRALTPAHFLIGDTFTNLPELNLTDLPVNRLSNWEHIQYVKQHFWKRWSKEYLNQLNVRSKWQFQKSDNIKIGTMVLLKEDNAPTLHWPLGRIVEVFPGDDGIVRVISVKTHSGVYKRAVTRVVPLPI
ncbi:uncharacterized protein LOC127287922 [Leptopilina boulardi]|uniref:uncharacterized protein LOC127287922 n=1 Tax=Leptopilina boulardi TaxID=63433 RepID=UPI0021F66114|nr:uncharacterized protein LOC127287922 [Leptopilina boulardi]